ncbi:succinylglutamate desuccinylase [Pandoraea eparura]|uniref:Succinylglutamate desuccinylase n=1 Tax=Pandoraea eparura TaxID=2508291 RepID=A0A5E4S4Y5_9BURK|nr:succinylglutamate desuccinylase [Pandoraea eparura]
MYGSAPDTFGKNIANPIGMIWSDAMMLDFLLDLHSMHERAAPLSVCGPLDKGIALARKLAVPDWIISDERHPRGRRTRDYAGFSDPDSSKNALLIECAQHWEAAALAVAQDVAARLLVLHRIVEPMDLPDGWQLRPGATVVRLRYLLT